MQKKVLIIKTGRSETFAASPLVTPSLGDVLRSTVLLHAFPGCSITWMTSSEAFGLFTGNPLISVIVLEQQFDAIRNDEFDVVVNLESAPAWVSWARNCRAPEKFGVGLSCDTGSGLSVQVQPWQQRLFRLINRDWSGEEYVYSFPERSEPTIHDVGLNWKVGTKWPEKAWSPRHWEELHGRLSPVWAVSWQQGFDSITDYARWIAGCRTIITTDSLGLHLALALKRKVVALFGPTSTRETPLYGRGVPISAPGGVMDRLTATDVEEAFLGSREARAS